MIPNPLTPPNEHSAEAAAVDDGVAYLGANELVTQLSLATPVSNANMGLDELDEMSDMDDGRPDEQYMADEDQDMSEIHDPPAMTALELAAAHNAEMDAIDAEIAGPQMYDHNSYDAYQQDPYPDPFQEQDYYSYGSMDQEENSQEVYMHNPGSIVNLPSAMSAVSLHLQHLQEEQEHAESAEAMDEIHGTNNMEEPFNLSLSDFLYNWGMSAEANGDARRRRKGPDLSVLSKQRIEQLTTVQRKDLDGERCDFQRMNWEELGVSRLEARQMRRNSYRNYQNLRYTNHVWHPRINGSKLDDDQNFFRFRRMDFDHNVNLAHFQLRNLMACASRDHVFYAGRSKIMQWHPRGGLYSGKPSVAMDLTNPIVQPFHSNHLGIQISTLTVAHDILVAGGFNGEYAMVNLRLPQGARHTEGLITDHMNSITNHVQVQLSRTSALPLAAFASNDMGMRILDVNTNKFIAEHKYDHAINCTAISPDQRLRVLVGDTRDVMICNAETGEVLHRLEGHRDFGFACDWADDGWTVATGNQDMQIKIWDARMWKGSSGQATPLATIAAEMAGVRKLKFSPLGSGKRVLLAAEPADFISVIDADSFTCKQNLSFFGEIGGVDFTDGGRDVLVANCDSMRGGIMEFERCDFADNDLFDLEERSERRRRCLRPRAGYDWVPDEDVVEHPKAQGTWQQRTRKAATLGVSLDHF